MDLLSQQRAEREARILATARALITERGYEGVTIRELARASRVSVPTLYKLFGDKNALLLRAVSSQLRELLARVDDAEATAGVELLLAVPEWAGRAMLREPRYARSVISVFIGSGQIRDVMETVFGALTDELECALRRIGADGELLPWVEPRILAERLASHHVMVCMQWASGQLPNRALPAALVYGLCMATLGGTRGEAQARIAARAREVQAEAAVSRGATARRADLP